MDNREKILKLYFEKKYRPIDIAMKLGISNSYITKIIKSNPSYLTEKEERKVQNKLKNIEQTKEYIKNKRIQNAILDAQIKQQHIQATIELSGGKNINNRAFRKWNSSAYKYNDKKKRFEFKNKLGRSYAVPKYVK